MIVVLMGPTGSGKSKLGVELAKRINGEIVNGDAFQVYDEVRIAVATPTKEEMGDIPHHLFSFIPPSEEYNIARYQEDARKAIEEILSRGKTPIMVGGSGLYIRSALYDYDLEIDTSNVDMSEYGAKTNEELHAILEKLDIQEANKITVENRRRLLRSISICLASGTSKTELLSKQNHDPIYPDCHFFAISTNRELLYPSLDKRVDRMFEDGIVDEVVPLIKKYDAKGGLFKAIGVKEFIPFIEGDAPLESVKENIKVNTRHYVKRQDTFFRHQFPTQYISDIEDILKLL